MNDSVKHEAGLTTVLSSVDARATMRRLIAAVRSRGLTVFSNIDHAFAASRAGLMLRPTQLLVFGDPYGGGPLMQVDQTLGLDLPLRALVWTDADGRTWLSHVDPVALARSHGGSERLRAPIRAMTELLDAVTAEATGPLRPEELLDEALADASPASDPPGV